MLPVLYYGEFSYTADVPQVDQKFKLEVKMVLNEHHKIDKIDLGTVECCDVTAVRTHVY